MSTRFSIVRGTARRGAPVLLASALCGGLFAAVWAGVATPVVHAAPAAQPVHARTQPVARATTPARPRVLEWDDLVPADFRPEAMLGDISQLASLQDTDPRAIELLARLKKMYDEAPVERALNNAYVKIPGYAIPLDQADGKTFSFLLVPYYGACIHEPPPPANQIVLVSVPSGARIANAFDVVWVTGTLSARHATTRYATAGYGLRANRVEPYRVEDDPNG